MILGFLAYAVYSLYIYKFLYVQSRMFTHDLVLRVLQVFKVSAVICMPQIIDLSSMLAWIIGFVPFDM